MTADDQKRRAAEAALRYIEPGMTVGLGTGSTAAHFVRALGAKAREGFEVAGVPTSDATAKLAVDEGIALVEPDETTRIDVTVDGADECDGRLDLIKGGGGALLREKIIACASERMVVIADASKHVAQLGKFPLPIEIDRFSWSLTVRAVRKALAAHVRADIDLNLRAGPKGAGFFQSDGGNYILDAECERIPDATALDAALRAIPGVVETGLFIGVASVALFGTDDGVETVTR